MWQAVAGLAGISHGQWPVATFPAGMRAKGFTGRIPLTPTYMFGQTPEKSNAGQ